MLSSALTWQIYHDLGSLAIHKFATSWSSWSSSSFMSLSWFLWSWSCVTGWWSCCHSSARSARCQVSHSPNHCAPPSSLLLHICITKFTKTLPYSWSSKDHPYDRAFETETEWIYVESVILVLETETRPQPRGHWHRSVATAPELWCRVTHFPEMTRDLIFLTTELISSMMTNGNNDKDDEYECVRWESHVVPRATKA